MDNTGTGAKAFGEMLKREEVGGRDLRGIFDWDGKGVPGVEKCSNEDGEFQLQEWVEEWGGTRAGERR